MRDPLFLPTDQSPGQMMGAWSQALSVAAYDLGMWFQAELDGRNRDWKRQLEAHRREFVKHYQVHVTDPSWVFKEPTYERSPIGELLPYGFRDAFRGVLRRRNDWFHRNVQWDLGQLRRAIDDLCSATAYVPSARFNNESSALQAYLDLLAQHGALPTERETELQDLLNQQETALIDAIDRVRELEGLLDKLQDSPALPDDVSEALRNEIAEARLKAEDAEERARLLAEAVEKLTSAPRDLNPDDLLPADLLPGDPWPQDVPLGRRRMRLLAAPQNGIFEVATGDFITAELGDVARQAAARWHEVMPLGGDIWVTRGWRTAGQVNGRTTYLGRLDEPPDQERVLGASMQDYLLPQSYRLLDGDIEDERAEALLSRAIGTEAAALVAGRVADAAAAADASGLFDEDDRSAILDAPLDLRVSLRGHIATTSHGRRCYLTSVAPDEWFPGVLRATAKPLTGKCATLGRSFPPH